MKANPYKEDPFEKIFGPSHPPKKVQKRQLNQEEYDLITNFQKLRINDNFHHISKKESQHAITPEMKNLLEVSPISNEILNQTSPISNDINFYEAAVNAKYINEDQQRSDYEIPNAQVSGVIEDVYDQKARYLIEDNFNETEKRIKYVKNIQKQEEREYRRAKLLRKGIALIEEEEEEDEIEFPEDDENKNWTDMEKPVFFRTMEERNYRNNFSDDESSESDSNAEKNGAYPSDNDSDENGGEEEDFM